MILQLLPSLIAISSALAGESVSPYIDELKATMPESPASATKPVPGEPDPYIQGIREGIKKRDAELGDEGSEGYTEELKRSSGETKEAGPTTSYTEEIKQKLDSQKKETGSSSAIEAVREGHSELHAKKSGDIHQAFGLRYGVSMKRTITASGDSAGRNFDDLYGGNYAPSIALVYEYQPFHSEWYGNIGFMGQIGVEYFHGAGAFQFPLINGATNQPFPNVSQTQFQFFSVPIIAGVDYRFNLLRLVRPFVMVGGEVIGYFEGRNDNISGHRGNSRGVFFAGGASLLLDWISPGASWDLYAEHDVKHYYLTAEFDQLSTFSGDVKFSESGFHLGLTYEF